MLSLRDLKGRYISEECKGEKNIRWNKIGQHQRTDGRWLIRINGVWLLRDRAVVEAKIGRKLTKSEIIHHLNGNKEDDRIENLKITNRAKHRIMHPSVKNKPLYNFDKNYLKERLKTISRNKLAKELGCNPWVFRRILGEL